MVSVIIELIYDTWVTEPCRPSKNLFQKALLFQNVKASLIEVSDILRNLKWQKHLYFSNTRRFNYTHNIM